MALNIKDAETERLAAEVAAMAGESKTRAVRRALQERKERLAFQVVGGDRDRRLIEFLTREVWALVPRSQLGRRLTKRQEERLLGYGPGGV